MRLFVCYGTWGPAPRPGGHPCGAAARALREAGHQPEIVRTYGLGMLPEVFNRPFAGRRAVKALTGNNWVPTLQLDDGTVIDGSRQIVQWARANPAPSTTQGA